MDKVGLLLGSHIPKDRRLLVNNATVPANVGNGHLGRVKVNHLARNDAQTRNGRLTFFVLI
jgi:hypothetical protein